MLSPRTASFVYRFSQRDVNPCARSIDLNNFSSFSQNNIIRRVHLSRYDVNTLLIWSVTLFGEYIHLRSAGVGGRYGEGVTYIIILLCTVYIIYYAAVHDGHAASFRSRGANNIYVVQIARSSNSPIFYLFNIPPRRPRMRCIGFYSYNTRIVSMII